LQLPLIFLYPARWRAIVHKMRNPSCPHPPGTSPTALMHVSTCVVAWCWGKQRAGVSPMASLLGGNTL